MALFRVTPTSGDRYIAEEVASHARPAPEGVAEALTWGADEHLLLGCAAVAWLVATARRSPLEPAAKHLLIVAATTAAVPHVLKLVFDQERPDRRIARSRLHGIPRSGDSMDAFPSGHALHMGALASAASVLPKRYKWPVWGLALGLSGTRVAILAHWLSDVAAGFVMGIGLERAIRCVTGYPDARLRKLISEEKKP